MGEIWLKEVCPYCTAINWRYLFRQYDPDCAKEDPPLITKCHKCLKNFFDCDSDFDSLYAPDIINPELWEQVEYSAEKYIELTDDYEMGQPNS